MLLSNSLYLDVVPQMMAGIIMNRIIGRRRSGPWARTVDREDPTGVSFPSLGGFLDKENIFPVLLSWFCGSVWYTMQRLVHKM